MTRFNVIVLSSAISVIFTACEGKIPIAPSTVYGINLTPQIVHMRVGETAQFKAIGGYGTNHNFFIQPENASRFVTLRRTTSYTAEVRAIKSTNGEPIFFVASYVHDPSITARASIYIDK